jgi:hypothetical protein
MITKFFPNADIKENTDDTIEFCLYSADEDLFKDVKKLTDKLGFKFFLIERNKDFTIRVVIKK